MAPSYFANSVIKPIAIAETLPLRQSVLWPDKPLSYVQLPEDETGQHFGAFITIPDANSQFQITKLVGIISLFIDENGRARFRKFATAPEWQGKGVGSVLLQHTIEAAKTAGAKSIWCDARQTALEFYRRFGMEAEGDIFDKGGLPYLRMSRTLA
ncbi:N-acetyltransferase GCN5 [Xylariaceae sp. FL1272]|nr:N-acetyltransferase GCN5 [Xylariaceae sp. FL1272]